MPCVFKRPCLVVESLTSLSQMFNQRMARKPLLHLALWTTAFSLANAASFSLPSDSENFVPACAQSCLQSVVFADFGAVPCGSRPSLQCLCRETGKSGFTIGEFAVQCIVAERNRKTCRGYEASGRYPRAPLRSLQTHTLRFDRPSCGESI